MLHSEFYVACEIDDTEYQRYTQHRHSENKQDKQGFLFHTVPPSDIILSQKIQ
jgi:hypothetical protein